MADADEWTVSLVGVDKTTPLQPVSAIKAIRARARLGLAAAKGLYDRFWYQVSR